MKYFVIFWKSTLWTIFMLLIFLMPSDSIAKAPSLPFISEFVHIIMFAIFYWLLIYDHLKSKNNSSPERKHLIIACIAGVSFGILIEILQEITGLGRKAEGRDIIYDTAGILLALGIIILFNRNKKNEIKD